MPANNLNRRIIVKINIGSSLKDNLLSQVRGRLKKGRQTKLVTPNPEFIVKAYHEPGFKNTMDKFDYSIPDGSYLFWAKYLQDKRARLRLYNTLSKTKKAVFNTIWACQGAYQLHFRGLAMAKLTGVDFMDDLIAMAAKEDMSVYFLGGRDGVAGKTAKYFKKKYDDLKVAGWYEGEAGIEGDKDVVMMIKKAAKRQRKRSVDLLFVAYGMGKQEEWIMRNKDKLKVNFLIGIGGAFDYYSGKVRRAPLWLRQRGGEWLFRILVQPWRIKRQIKLLEFIYLVWSEKVKIDFKKI
jgi:N-acetylglucosaminyldiphosphoundecaprenol N-acetyl-beta-D-mannosaminyltransferase